MTNRPYSLPLALAALAFLPSPAHAGGTAAQRANVNMQRAEAHYAVDRKICAEQANPAVRAQCSQDANAEYNKAMGAARASLRAAGNGASPQAYCKDCGRVLTVKMVEKAGQGTGLGVVAGGVTGALLGNQIGGGNGRTLATVAGAAGGAYAGNAIEQNARSTKVWSVAVQYDSGRKGYFSFGRHPGLAPGDKVRNAGNTIVRR